MINLTCFLKKEISADLITLDRVGGYSAENYVATFDGGQKYFVKLLRDNAQNYIAKLKSVTDILDENPRIPFFKPVILNDVSNIIVFPYVDGRVLHGLDIGRVHCDGIVSDLLANFSLLNPEKLPEHSFKLFEDMDSSISEINSILGALQKDNKYHQIITDILNLKLGLIDKYAYNPELINWVKQSNNFVHGDFHNENILFKNNSVAAVIDFELAHRGHLAEDPINFIWFAFLNSDFSAENLMRASEFLQLARDNLGLTEIDVVNGFKFLYIKLFSSAFLETSLLRYGDDFYAGLLQRDVKKFKYIDDNLSKILNSLLKP